MKFTGRNVRVPRLAAIAALALAPWLLGAAPAAPPAGQTEPQKPLQLTLSQAALDAIIARYQAETGAGQPTQLQEIAVSAPRAPLPMVDTTQEIWGGIASPIWALIHPTEAWRIFLPVPPK